MKEGSALREQALRTVATWYTVRTIHPSLSRRHKYIDAWYAECDRLLAMQELELKHRPIIEGPKR